MYQIHKSKLKKNIKVKKGYTKTLKKFTWKKMKVEDVWIDKSSVAPCRTHISFVVWNLPKKTNCCENTSVVYMLCRTAQKWYEKVFLK